MAQLVRRKKSPFWYVRYQQGGKDHWVSTQTAKRKEATEKMALILARAFGQLTVDHAFDELLKELQRLPTEIRLERSQAIARRLLAGSQSTLALADAWQTWFDNPNKRGEPSGNTMRQYESQWKRFEKWAAGRKLAHMHDVDGADALDYAADLWKDKVTPSTFNRHIQFLRAVFALLATQAGLLTNPWASVHSKALRVKGRRNFTTEELQNVCSKSRGSLRHLIALGLYTGMRLGDCVLLRWAEVDLKAGMIDHIPMKTRRVGRRVRIPIHPVLAAMLAELRERNPKADDLFPEEAAEYRTDPIAVSHRFQRFLTDCGIETTEARAEGEQRKKGACRVGFHSLRHSFVSLCAANRVPQVAIMELVGHGSPAMTALYSHAGDEQKTAAIAALPAMTFDAPETAKE
jgi:integrase